ncbi:MAG: dihydroorotate dehydrogenase-like protein [Candidatus Promineifilaceae bacterium]|nr:dihydroorotate dehydrogenase-like protein [Candidatus Promineifilaceae bacterium]
MSIELTTHYLGLKLRNPIVASASPLSRNVGTIRRMEDTGVGAVVLYSLFEEEINADSHTLNRVLLQGTEISPEVTGFFPEARNYDAVGPDGYLKHIRRAKDAVEIPIIASLNGVSTGGWIDYARRIEQAGADALELNIYFLPTDPNMTGGEVEQIYIDVLRDVKEAVSIPVAIKIGPFFSAMANMARRLDEAGADGLVLFNRFYQPDLDLEALEVTPNLVLSTSHELRLPLRWIALLYGRVDADLALTTGVHTGEDVLKGLAAGASVVMMTSELLTNGVGRIGEMLAEVVMWLVENEYESLDELRGSLSQINAAAPALFERANYLQIVRSFGPEYV